MVLVYNCYVNCRGGRADPGKPAGGKSPQHGHISVVDSVIELRGSI